MTWWRAQLAAIRSGDDFRLLGTGAWGPCCVCLLMLVFGIFCLLDLLAMLLVV